MSAVINTNMAAIRTHGVYNRNNTEMNDAMTRVATAQKVNSVRDNASDWAISEKMRERIRSLNQASQNVQNDTAMMKTASGALGNTIDIIKTLKERAVNAANDSNQDTDRAKIQVDINQLLTQIDKNAEVKYNGKALIDGTTEDKQVTTAAFFWSGVDTSKKLVSDLGLTANEAIKINYNKYDSTTSSMVAASEVTFSVAGASDNKTVADLLGSITGLSGSAVTIATGEKEASLGVTNKYGDAVNVSSEGYKMIASTSGLAGNISDVVFSTSSSSASVKAYVATLNAGFKQIQEGADKVDGVPLSFQVGDDSDLSMEVTMGDMTSEGLGLKGISVSTQEGAKSAMSTIDAALEKALEQQTKLGSIESRLGYTADNLSTQIENLEASDSAIRDADMAKEMTNYMKYAVLSQASQYMLAQAGQNAFQVLNLLQQ